VLGLGDYRLSLRAPQPFCQRGPPQPGQGVTVLPEGEAGTSLQAIAVTGRRVR